VFLYEALGGDFNSFLSRMQSLPLFIAANQDLSGKGVPAEGDPLSTRTQNFLQLLLTTGGSLCIL